MQLLVKNSLSLLVHIKSSMIVFFVEKCEKFFINFVNNCWFLAYTTFVNCNVWLTRDIFSFEDWAPSG